MTTKSYTRPGYPTVTTGINVKNPDDFISWATRALGAETVMRVTTADGTVRHAEVRIGDTIIAADAAVRDPETKGAMFHVYVPDADAAYKRALEAGSTPKMPPTDMFFGERVGAVGDPFGNAWGLATFLREPTADEIRDGAEAMAARLRG